MPKTPSKRAIEGRNWRISAREKRRLNTVISEYIRLTRKDLYSECKTFYDSVVQSYTEKQNLTKTFEFRLLIHKYNQKLFEAEAPAASNEVEVTTISDETAREQPPEAEAPAASNEVEVATTSDETAREQPPEAEPPAASDEVEATTTSGETVSIGWTYVEPGLTINQYVINNNQDILLEAMNSTIEDIRDDGLDRDEDMFRTVREIVRDLEDVEPGIFHPEDEGIGLNVEDEIGNMLADYDIDNLW